MRLGDLIFVRGTEWTDHLVKSVTQSPYSHVAGIVAENRLVEAQAFRRTGYRDFDVYADIADVYTCDQLTNEQREKIVRFTIGQIGTQYDYLLLLWEAARYLLDWVWPYMEKKRYICSTLWANAYRVAGVNLCPRVRYPTPNDLVKSPLLRKV